MAAKKGKGSRDAAERFGVATPPDQLPPPDLLEKDTRSISEKRKSAMAEMDQAVAMDVRRWIAENQYGMGMNMEFGDVLEQVRIKDARLEWEVEGVTMRRTDLMRLICAVITEGGLLKSLCRVPGMPRLDTVLGWREEYPEFDTAFRLADEARAYSWMEDTVAISDDTTASDSYCSKLRIDTRLTLARQLDPKRWNPKAPTPSGVDVMSDAEIQAKVKSMLLTNGERYLKELGIAVIPLDQLGKWAVKHAKLFEEKGVCVAKSTDFVDSAADQIAASMTAMAKVQ